MEQKIIKIISVDFFVQDGLSGKTPLHYIIEKKNPELISWYLDMADSFYQKQFSFEQQSQLDRSIIRYPSVHEILNTRMSSGNTCLHLALGLAMERREKEKILELLIKSGAQLTNKTTDGRLKRTLMKIPSVSISCQHLQNGLFGIIQILFIFCCFETSEWAQ